jgi:hypothetical protein
VYVCMHICWLLLLLLLLLLLMLQQLRVCVWQ